MYSTATATQTIGYQGTKKNRPELSLNGRFGKNPGDVLLSHGEPHSTIGARELSF